MKPLSMIYVPPTLIIFSTFSQPKTGHQCTIHFYILIQNAIFLKTLRACMESIPQKSVRTSNHDKPWITPLVKSLISRRWKAYQNKQFHIYNHLKLKIETEIGNAKLKWGHHLSRVSIWKTVRKIKSSNPNALSPVILSYPNTSEAANAINSKFASVFVQPSSYNYDSSTNNNIFPNGICTHTIYTMLTKLKKNKAFGHNQIPIIIYKVGALFLAEPLAHPIALSMELGIVPTLWKTVDVTPLPKSSPANINNLPPLSPLSIPAKLGTS